MKSNIRVGYCFFLLLSGMKFVPNAGLQTSTAGDVARDHFDWDGQRRLLSEEFHYWLENERQRLTSRLADSYGAVVALRVGKVCSQLCTL